MALIFAGDNVDHNILTIDGMETFHGMGIITALTSGRKKDHAIQRRNIIKIDISVISKIAIIEHRFANHVRQTIMFEQLPALVSDKTIRVLWELSLNFGQETPGWQGIMHIIHQGLEHPGQSPMHFCLYDRLVLLRQDTNSVHA